MTKSEALRKAKAEVATLAMRASQTHGGGWVPRFTSNGHWVECIQYVDDRNGSYGPGTYMDCWHETKKEVEDCWECFKKAAIKWLAKQYEGVDKRFVA